MKSLTEYEAEVQAIERDRAAHDLYHDLNSPRLRDKRKTDDHAVDCGCHFCVKICCLLCHELKKNPFTATGKPAWGRHLQSQHPAYASPAKRRASQLRRTQRNIEELAMAEQIQHFSRVGLRKVPLKAFTERELRLLDMWVKDVRIKDKHLLLQAMERADDRITTKQKFDSVMRRLDAEIEAGSLTGTTILTKRETNYDPRVTIEIVKLCYATKRGWNFVVHLLLLYGINAFCESLRSEGVSPPSFLKSLPDPGSIIATLAESATEVVLGEHRETL